MTNHHSEDAQQAVRELLSGSRDEELSVRLLSAFQRGLDLEYLRELLWSDQEHAQRAGVWIASELGNRASAVIQELGALAANRSRYVRFFAIDAILASATSQDGDAIAAAIRGIGDDDPAIRWKTMQLLARASEPQLNAARDFLPRDLAERTAWLLSGPDAGEVEAMLKSRDPASELFAASAAARLRPNDLTALRRAAENANDEVSSFALEFLRHDD